MIDTYVSIVTGTYNRIEHLKALVQSIQNSVGLGITYEIIIVDGGSTDGTQEWCLRQKDIKFIQQGKLLGAVKAFNAGAYAASGKYVILANDDVEFIDDSIVRSIVFMDENPRVGIGCFYQDRFGPDFSVEYMPATFENGVRFQTPYGQVCIVRKWLGELVGWWGDYLHTYGGDNELSCQVLEAGYGIVPINCCCVHDKVVKDELREINHPDRNPNDPESDGAKWRARWSKNRLGTFGPIAMRDPVITCKEENLPRILYGPIYEKTYAHIQKISKHGLRDALAKRFLTLEADFSDGPALLVEAAKAFKPDMFLMQVHNDWALSHEVMDELRSTYPNAFFMSWNGDYNRKQLGSESYMRLLQKFDLATFAVAGIKYEFFNKEKTFNYWQIGYETYAEKPLTDERYDVVFLGNCYSKDRVTIGLTLRSIPGITFGLFGAWPKELGLHPAGNTLYDFAEGDRIYRSSKLAIGDCQFPESEGYVSNRLFQAMYSGVCLMQQRFARMEDLLGLKDGENVICWDNILDLPEIIKYWLDPSRDQKRKEIGKAGKELMMEKHSFDRRVDKLYEWYLEFKTGQNRNLRK